MITPAGGWIGASMRRTEDPELITGGGRYVDDIVLADTAHVAFVRSTEAHALLRAVDTSEAKAMPGVIGVFTAADLGVDRPMPNPYPHPAIEHGRQTSPLAVEEVCYVGEAVAVVVAETRYQAADAAEAVWIDYEPLPAVASLEAAVAEGAPMVNHGSSTNVVATLTASYGDVAAVFADAQVTFPLELRQHRGACASMEPRGVLAHRTHQRTTVWSSTQAPFPLRQRIADYLGLDDVRVIAPDVGGGFGPKGAIYAEEYAVAALAGHLDRPVKWIETRREHLVATHQQRDMVAWLEVAATEDGRLLGLRGRILHDNGAYVPYGVLLHLTGLQLVQGPYTPEAMDIALEVVSTNAVPTSPIRGAARPNAAFLAERVMDAIARHTGVDGAEVRRRNFIPADAFPYEYPLAARFGGNLTYDSGDYHQSLEAVLALAELDGFEDRREEARRRGRLLGFGIAAYVEDTGLGPFEQARVELSPTGDVMVTVGTGSQGQGHGTVLAQLAAAALGVDPVDVQIRSGDTSLPGNGVPTVASRTAVAAGSSTKLAADGLADLIRRRAADMLEAAEADLVLDDGTVAVRGQPGASITFAELAGETAAEGEELVADAAHPAAIPPYAFGCHVAEVEVDPDTGLVVVARYSVAHDCGTVLNPMIVDGQIDGGVAHGLSNALFEQVAYSEDGQPLTTTFMDFRIPTAVEMPHIGKVHTVTPAPDNPLGVKGAGEGGTIPAMAAVASAVEHALEDLGVVVDRYPLFPSVVRRMIDEATNGRNR